MADRKVAGTISIEVGMQNSGLGAVLARQNFSNPLVAIPSDSGSSGVTRTAGPFTIGDEPPSVFAPIIRNLGASGLASRHLGTR